MTNLDDSSLFIEVNFSSDLKDNVIICNREENDRKLIKESTDTTQIPLSLFGVLTDIQYSDHETHISFDNKHRYYRNSLNLVNHAVSDLRNYGKLDFILELGDIIDGKCISLNDSLNSMNKVLDELRRNQKDMQILHVWGNHEFYNFKRSEIIELELNTALNLKQDVGKHSNYYYYDVTDFLRIVCLDFYEFSVLGYEPTDQKYLEATKYIESLDKSEFSCPKLNGAIKGEQLKWLENQLDMCRNLNKKVILCGHNPLLKEASKEKFLSLNANQILDLIRSYDNLVLAYLSGHFHAGGYFKDKCGTHHITLPGIIEKKPGSNSFLVVKVYETKIEFYLNNN